MTESQPRLPADNPTVLLGVVTILSGVATGLLAFVSWVAAIGLILWGPESRTRPGSRTRAAFVATTAGAFVLTAFCLPMRS